jgi:hypothetical protein
MIGGFIGSAEAAISDSYAMGNVFIDTKGTGDINAGGFTGYLGRFMYLTNALGSLQRCFALGSVTIHRNNESGVSNAGGLVGSTSDYSNSIYKFIRNSVAADPPRNMHTGINVTGGDARNIGRIYGTYMYGGNLLGSHAWSGLRLFSDPRYDPRDPAEIIYHPAMSGSLELQGSMDNASISVSISDVISNTSLYAQRPIGSNVPVYQISWNGRDTINNIDLRNFNSTDQYLWFNITVNLAIYRIEVRPTRDAAGDPLTLADYSVTNLGLLNRKDFLLNPDIRDPHGTDASSGDLRTSAFWTGLGYTNANEWDTTGIEGRGFPLLTNVRGQENNRIKP